MIYEDRHTLVNIRAGRDYLEMCRQKIIPAIRAAGGHHLVLATGLVGDPGNSFLQFTGYESFSAWEAAQGAFPPERQQYVEEEQVRLLRPVVPDPVVELPVEDRRPAYGYRRFFIDPASLADFVRYSREGVWPLFHARGCRMLGLWTPLAATSPMEILLITGYYGPGHWEATRLFSGKPDDVDQELWDRGRELGEKRSRLLVNRSWVRLFRAHHFD